MDEQALADTIRGAQRGDAKAFDLLMDQYGNRIYGFAFRCTGSRHDAEDLMQEVFLRVVRSIGGYDDDGRFEAWLFRIAANLIRDRARRQKRTSRGTGHGGSDNGRGSHGDPLLDARAAHQPADAGLLKSEDVDALQRCLTRLPEAEREVILLRHFSQLSFKEIADTMGTPLGTALARAHRGLAHLREMMGETETAPPKKAASYNSAPVV